MLEFNDCNASNSGTLSCPPMSSGGPSTPHSISNVDLGLMLSGLFTFIIYTLLYLILQSIQRYHLLLFSSQLC